MDTRDSQMGKKWVLLSRVFPFRKNTCPLSRFRERSKYAVGALASTLGVQMRGGGGGGSALEAGGPGRLERSGLTLWVRPRAAEPFGRSQKCFPVAAESLGLYLFMGRATHRRHNRRVMNDSLLLCHSSKPRFLLLA